MRRRDFLGALGGAAAWPVIARAQQPPMPVIGFLHSASAAGFADLMPAFRKGLGKSGYIEGQSVVIEYRWGEGHNEHLPAMAEELVRRQVAVIVTPISTAAALAAGAATDDSHRLRHRRRPGENRPCRQPQPAGRQCNRC